MSFRRSASPFIALASIFALSEALAFQPLVTDDTGTQGTGGNQVELAATRTSIDLPGGTAKAGDIAFVFTRGLTDTLDVFVELGRQRIDDTTTVETGPTNTAIGAKWRFYENERKTSLAVKPILILPVSAENESKGMGTGKTSYEVSLILTQEMGWGAVHANLVGGRSKFKDPAAEEEKESRFSVAPVWNLDEHWKLAVDLGASRTRSTSQTVRSRFGELGAIYSPNADLDFALGFIRQKDQDTDEVAKTATAGVTWRFK
jgi:hypothetical protein